MAAFKLLTQKLCMLLGIDAAIVNIITARLWSLLAGPIGIFLVTTRLTQVEQGLYYTFGSILALKIFLELGLIYIIIQFAAQEAAHLKWENGVLIGNTDSKSRLSSLMRLASKWYTAVAVLMLVLILPIGLYFFDKPGVENIQWRIPWILMVLASSLGIIGSPLMAILEGCGKVVEVTRVRMFEGMALGIILWIGLIFGFKLYALALSAFAGFAVPASWMLFKKLSFFKDIYCSKKSAEISWKEELIPLQWRIAVTWISGYFAYQLFTPLIFAANGHDKGPEAAGRIGVTLTILGVIGAVSLSWMQTKASPFGIMAARKEFDELDTLYRKTFWQSTLVYVVGCLSLLLVLYLMKILEVVMVQRFASFPVIIVFMIALGLNYSVFNRTAYFRAFKKEPVYKMHLINGIWVGTILTLLISHVSVLNLAIIYCLASCFPSALYTSWMFTTWKNEVQSI